jgi:hypothetical protein
VNVKIIEIDGERRRLSLSLKRIEDDEPVQPRADGGESVHLTPQLDLGEDPGDEAADAAPALEPAAVAEPAAEEPAAVAEPPAEEPAAEAAEEPAEE